MKELLLGKKSCDNGIGTRNPRISYYTGGGGVVECQIPAQTGGDKTDIINAELNRVKQNIDNMKPDRLNNSIGLIVRAVEGRAVVGARTGADRKLLVIQEIKEEIGKINFSMTQEQDEKMKSFYQDLIIALQEKQESVYDALNPAQIAKLKTTQNTK